MIGNLKRFITPEAMSRGKITLGDKTTKKVVSSGTIGKYDSIVIKIFLIVKGLKYILLSISNFMTKILVLNFFLPNP